MKDSHTRSVLKGFSWRTVGTLDTFLIATFVTGYEFSQAGLIAIAEIFTKIFFFYLHERVWSLLARKHSESHYGSVGKAISWRFIGTLDTIILSSLITGSINMGMSIGGIELVTKIVLYYLHERAWNMIPYGRVPQESFPSQVQQVRDGKTPSSQDYSNSNGESSS